jgi:hypothetical protein
MTKNYYQNNKHPKIEKEWLEAFFSGIVSDLGLSKMEKNTYRV